MNRPLYQRIDPARDTGEGLGPDPPGGTPLARRSCGGWIVALTVTATILVAGAFLLTGCSAEPIEEVGVEDVTEDGQAVHPEDETVSLTGEVDEILTESAVTVTDERSEEPLLVLLTPATIVNGMAVTPGGQPGGIGQVISPEGTLQIIGTIDTFDSLALAEQLGIVLNEELFAPWEGDPVLIAAQVETFDPVADLAADTGPSPSDAVTSDE